MWLEERSELYLPSSKSRTEVATRIRALDLSPAQEAELMSITQLVIAETIYGLLCGLEGYGSIGQSQDTYELRDESGQILTGELDSMFFNRVQALNRT